MMLDLEEVSRALGANAASGGAVTGWSVDTRTLAAGDLFFALRGPAHDGHCFVESAFQKGASAAVVERPFAAFPAAIAVPDTQAALESLASWARGRWTGRMIAVTGSAGKTTTKDIIAAMLAAALSVGKTAGNLNNHVGLPLSILRLPEEARAAVIEIGMNHAGEIRRLAAIARPDIGVVTNVGLAHAEFFPDGIEGVARAKRELVESLPADGVAVLNADDARVLRFREAHPGRAITFGLDPRADVHPESVECAAGGVRLRIGGTVFQSSLAGAHNARNILAGIAVAGEFGIPPERLVEAVRDLKAGAMRGERFAHAGITILNDCYNSNPEAARSMLDVLRATPARRRIAVLGEMLELGRWSEPLHRDVGRYVAQCGIDVLVGIRGAARQMVDEAVRSGLPAVAAFFYDEPEEAGAALRGIPQEGDAVLFKGSRGTHVEKALEKFLESR